MGDVPTYQPQAETRPLPLPLPMQDPSVSPDSFGASVGEGEQHLGGVASHLAARAKERADDVAVQRAQLQSRAALNSIILDPEQGYAATKGADAMAQRDGFLQRFDKAIDAAAAGLQNDDQRRMFANEALAIRDTGMQHAYGHEAVQQRAYAATQVRGNLDQTMLTLERSIADPQARKDQLGAVWQIGINAARSQFGQSASKEAIAGVVLPELQKAALGGMEAAIATQDPAVARGAFEDLGKYLVTNHQRFYAAAVQALETKKAVTTTAGSIIAEAAVPVAVPGAEPVARIDAAKVDAALAKLPPDDPRREQIEKAVELAQGVHDKVWNQTVAQVVQRVQTAGTDPVTGAFNLSAGAVKPDDRVWLQQNAPEKLIALRALDARAQEIDSGAAREESRGALADLLMDMTDTTRRAPTYGSMSTEEFNSDLTDLPLTPIDRKTAVREFAKIKKEAGLLVEKSTSVVKEELAKAFPTKPQEAKKYLPAVMQDVNAFIEQEKAANNGKAPSDAELHARVAYMLARPPGEHWWNSPDRRIEASVQQQTETARVPVQAASAVPASKTVRSYRYTPDRKRRAPIYSDGTQGPLEEVSQ